jgi:hypothetical protein
MRCVQLTGSDNRMDCRDMFHDPLNPLPPKCPKCEFPDIVHVPQPYYLVKSRTISSNEMAPAENGNLFVRDRVRRVLEILAPGQCDFYPTCYKNTAENTPWQLAVPNRQIRTGTVKASIPRCDACGEPRSAHPGSLWSERHMHHESEFDVLKSSTWGSSERGWNLWISRDLFMSVRMLHLLKKVKATGLVEATCGKPASPNDEESAWIRQQIEKLKQLGITANAAGTLSDEDARWFRAYLKSNAASGPVQFDAKAFEDHLKFKLPKSYKDFIAMVGPRSFQNVDEEEGFTANVLAPGKFDCEFYRKGKLQTEDDQSNAVDGVMFACTDHGDCFCFDVQKDKKEYAVYLYNHEGNFFEPYADNFVACIRRFVGE